MRAAICTAYGPPEVLRLSDVAKPAPRADEVLIKIHASTVNSSDWFIRSGIRDASLLTQVLMRLALGLTRPRRRIIGLVLAGEVEAIGPSVTRFQVHERVYGFTMLRLGCYAEYTCVRETSILARAPSTLSWGEAAAIPYGGLLALHYLTKGKLHAGQRLLVYGASSAVGTSAVQLAQILGAEVTAVCGPTNVELVRSLGASRVLDYTVDRAPPAGARYDLVFDAVGKRKTSALRVSCQQALAEGGRCLSVDDGSPKLQASELARLTQWAEAGTLRPVIDRRYSLEQIVEAHSYVEQEHKKGNVVIDIASRAS